jgi:hypothetical protein
MLASAWVMRHQTSVSDVSADLTRGLTSASARLVVAQGGAQLPRLSMSRSVSFTDRFTEAVSDLPSLDHLDGRTMARPSPLPLGLRPGQADDRRNLGHRREPGTSASLPAVPRRVGPPGPQPGASAAGCGRTCAVALIEVLRHIRQPQSLRLDRGEPAQRTRGRPLGEAHRRCRPAPAAGGACLRPPELSWRAPLPGTPGTGNRDRHQG